MAYRRPVPSSARLRFFAAVALSGGLTVLVGCDAERDLVAYFGTPAPSPSQTAISASPTPSPTASPAASPSPMPSPTSSPDASPEVSPSPVLPTRSPSPTRPPNLPSIRELRERAAEVPVARLLANPARFDGDLLYFEGRVLGVQDDGEGSFRARVRVGGGAVIHLTYEAATYWGQPLVQQDRIRVLGYFRGLSNQVTHGERVPVLEVYDLHVRFT